ncbi:MAG: FprA family A-type flavoprotein [Clostridiales bacterium]|nr:FprA family A-type flavoprotein [Clostridiales bacterium]
MKELTMDILHIGVDDHDLDLFEGQYEVPNGMAYNSYMILDEKNAVIDSVDQRVSSNWLKQINKNVDYLIISHMEPDHSGSVKEFMERFPKTTIVASSKAFVMMKQFYGEEYEDRRIIVKEGDTLLLGKHTLRFIMAPMVHWPEVMVTYDESAKVLFSADAFGKFGASDAKEEWACEARRYYVGIVGKFGMQVQNLLKKVGALDIECICPLHGPVLKENLEHYINLYDIWSSYRYETEGVMIAYTSVYGNTKRAVEELKNNLVANGCPKVVLTDLARCDMAEAVEDAFRYGKLVLATTTYNNEIFPFMREFINNLVERNYQDRTLAFIENGSWAPTAAKIMRNMFEKSKNIKYIGQDITIKSAITPDNLKELQELASVLCKN